MSRSRIRRRVKKHNYSLNWTAVQLGRRIRGVVSAASYFSRYPLVLPSQ
jgi:hypothetical protein